MKMIVYAVIVLAVLGSAFYIWRDFSSTLPPDEPGIVPVVEIPDLDRPINITADMPEEAKTIARSNIEKTVSELKENPDLFNSWITLGGSYKLIGDFEGARDSWDYAGSIRPGNSTSFNNLGDLYAYYLKDNEKAEENFLKAIENGPDKIFIYRNLYDFYRNVLKDEGKAKETLQKGIALNPDTSTDLQNLLDNFGN